MFDLLALIVMSLACWRLGNLLAEEPGPFGVFDKFRHMVGVRYTPESLPYGNNEFANMVLCIYCNTVWIGLVLTILFLLLDYIVVALCFPFALSAVAIVLDTYRKG